MAVRAQERGESERCPVIGWIGVETLPSRESAQTSSWSLFTREFVEPFLREASKCTLQHERVHFPA